VGLHEARHWHRRAYGGLSDVSHLQPTEIGHAAAYEAYRTWIHNSSIYEPLHGDAERQREGLIGLAVAEATRLLQYLGRPVDHYARTAASDAAAGTASIMFYQSRDSEDYDDRYRSRSRSRHRHGSFSNSSYSPDPYAYDDALYSHHHGGEHSRPRHRSHSRHRPRSHSRGPPSMMYGTPGGGVPIPGTSMHGGMLPGGYGAPSYGSNGSYGSYGAPGGQMPMQMGGPYSTMAPSYVTSGGMPMSVPGMSHSHRHRSNSVSYAPQYMPQGMYGVPAPQTIVISQPSSKHRHRHRRSESKHRRSHSSDGGHGGQLRIAYPVATSTKY
jgi:hypothetical protein